MMYGLGSRGGTPGGRFGGAFPVWTKPGKTLKCINFPNKPILKIYYLLLDYTHRKYCVYTSLFASVKSQHKLQKQSRAAMSVHTHYMSFVHPHFYPQGEICCIKPSAINFPLSCISKWQDCNTPRDKLCTGRGSRKENKSNVCERETEKHLQRNNQTEHKMSQDHGNPASDCEEMETNLSNPSSNKDNALVPNKKRVKKG